MSPTSRDRPSARGSARVALAVVGLVLALLAGCSTISSFTDLESDLDDAGFRDVRISLTTTRPVGLVVSADAPPGRTTAEGVAEAKEVIWTTFPRRFERLELTIDDEHDTLTYEHLEDELGARPERLDAGGDLESDVTRLGLFTLLGLLLAGVVVVALVAVLAIVLVRGNRRARAAAPPPTPWAPPATTGPPDPTPPSAASHPIPPLGTPPPPGATAPSDPARPSDPAYPGAPSGPIAPTPPPGGWTAARPDVWGGPPPSAPGTPTSTGGSDPSGGPDPSGPTGHPADDPTAPAIGVPTSATASRGEARLLGRRPRGPRPPAAQMPAGWDW